MMYKTDKMKSCPKPAAPRKSKKNRGSALGKVLIYAALILYLLWILFPFLILLLTSVTPQTELDSSMHFIWWPEKFSLEAYKTVLYEDIYAQMLYGDNLSSITPIIPLSKSLRRIRR